jgi:hypothetical protein
MLSCVVQFDPGMRKTFVSENDRQQIIRLRQSGAGWLQVQEITGVPRRTAKRVFEEERETSSLKETASARGQVAAQLFALHVGDLLTLAAAISRNLADPASEDRLTGQAIMASVLGEGLRSRQSAALPPLAPDRDRQTIERENRILLDSLKMHTRDTIDWKAFDAWLRGWDAWQTGSRELDTAAREVVKSRASHLRGKVRNLLNENAVQESIGQGIVRTLLCSLLENRLAEAKTLVNVREAHSAAVIRFGDKTPIDVPVTDTATASVVSSLVCLPAVEELTNGGRASVARDMAGLLSAMRASGAGLRDQLDELRLTPVILRTRCEICPA